MSAARSGWPARPPPCPACPPQLRAARVFAPVTAETPSAAWWPSHSSSNKWLSPTSTSPRYSWELTKSGRKQRSWPVKAAVKPTNNPFCRPAPTDFSRNFKITDKIPKFGVKIFSVVLKLTCTLVIPVVWCKVAAQPGLSWSLWCQCLRTQGWLLPKAASPPPFSQLRSGCWKFPGGGAWWEIISRLSVCSLVMSDPVRSPVFAEFCLRLKTLLKS